MIEPVSADAAGLTFGIDQLGNQCHPLQQIREITQNAIEANATIVEWDADWIGHSIDGGAYKLCCVDNGDGMSDADILRFIKKMWSTSKEQGFSGNFGVGTKIAAATRNHAGVDFLSWKDGAGHMARLYREGDCYGLYRFDVGGGKFISCPQIDDAMRPSHIIEVKGTKVVLRGMTEAQDTMKYPDGGKPRPYRWILKYLNSRYFVVKHGVTIRCFQKADSPEQDVGGMRTVHGMKHFLELRSSHSGDVRLSDATVRWWVLPEKEDNTKSDYLNSLFTTGGHIAALYQNELYDVSAAREGRARLQRMGVLSSPERVILYIEPDESAGAKPNVSRTSLEIAGQGLPWDRWGFEFRENMPEEIRALRGEDKTEKDLDKEVQALLSRHMDLIQLKYRPTPNGRLRVSDNTSRGGTPRILDESVNTPGPSKSGGRGGSNATGYALFLKEEGRQAEALKPKNPFPKVYWVSDNPMGDEMKRTDMDDRSARYLFEDNALLINADFRAFRNLVDRLAEEYVGVPDCLTVVERCTRKWWQLQLTEAVTSVLSLRNAADWTEDQIRSALSEESLTCTAMARYLMINEIKKAVSTQLGAIHKATAA